MRISDWSSDVCSSDLHRAAADLRLGERRREIAVDAHDLAGRAHLRPKHRIDAGETGEGKNRFLYGDMAKVAVIDLKVPEGRERLSGHHARSEEHTSELQSLMRISYAVFRLQKTTPHPPHHP